MGFGWFSSRCNPIALDFGTDSIKMLQLEPRDHQLHLLAAATTEIPEELRATPDKRDQFTVDALKKMLEKGFRGWHVVTCLPASQMAVQHLRVGKMSPEDLQKALPFEAHGKLPFDASRAMLRHMIAGEVYHEQEARMEVILMAASRESVERQLNVLSKAKLDAVGIHVEPMALIECFGHLFRRKSDENISTMFVDIGAGATHITICHGRGIVFAKYIFIGGDTLSKRVAEVTKCNLAAARALRLKISQESNETQRLPVGVMPLGNSPSATAGSITDEQVKAKVASALEEPVETLVTELQLCVRYYESIFGGKQIDRAIFVGGESRNVSFCQQLAQRLGVAAMIGDPLARLTKTEKTECLIDMRQPQPGWAVAVGLGMGVENN